MLPHFFNGKQASEINNKGFYIERSSDSKTWQTMDFVSSLARQGNSKELLGYRYADGAPRMGINYYRLKQEDIDGRTSYSPVRTLAFRDFAQILTLYPNPTDGSVLLKGLENGSRIQVYNCLGKLMQSLEATAGEAIMDIASYADGIYFISVTGNAGNSTRLQLIKK